MNYILALIGAGVAGICVSLQTALNAELGKTITPRLSALHSFIVGTIVLFLINILSGGFREYRLIAKTPPYLWIGGVLGVIIVYMGIKVVPVIGVAATVTMMVVLQMVSSIAIDSLGLFGADRIPLDAGRIFGVVLLIIAVWFIVK